MFAHKCLKCWLKVNETVSVLRKLYLPSTIGKLWAECHLSLESKCPVNFDWLIEAYPFPPFACSCQPYHVLGSHQPHLHSSWWHHTWAKDTLCISTPLSDFHIWERFTQKNDFLLWNFRSSPGKTIYSANMLGRPGFKSEFGLDGMICIFYYVTSQKIWNNSLELQFPW